MNPGNILKAHELHGGYRGEPPGWFQVEAAQPARASITVFAHLTEYFGAYNWGGMVLSFILVQNRQ